MKKKSIVLSLILMSTMLFSSCAWNSFLIITDTDSPISTITEKFINPTDPDRTEIAEQLGEPGDTVTVKGVVDYSNYSEIGGSMLQVHNIENEGYYFLYSSDRSMFSSYNQKEFFEATGTIREETQSRTFGSSHELDLQILEIASEDDIRYGTYMEIIDPAIDTIELDETVEFEGVSVTVKKIEVSEKETRIYASIKHDGEEWLYCNSGSGARVIQDNHEYISEYNNTVGSYNWASSLDPGEKSSGTAFIYTAVDTSKPFTLCIDMSTRDFEEYDHTFTFEITEEILANSNIQPKTETDTTEEKQDTKDNSNDELENTPEGEQA